MNKQKLTLIALVILLALPLVFEVQTAHADTTVSVAPSGDSMVSQGDPATNFGGAANFNTASTLGAVIRGLIQFDTSAYEPSHIISATLNITCTAVDPATLNVTVCAGFTELTVTWNSQPASSGSTVQAALSGTGTLSIDITSIYANSTTFAVVIQDSAEGSGGRTNVFSSREGATDPVLVLVVEEGPYFLEFHGVYDETSGAYTGECNVTAYFAAYPAETFEIDNDKTKGLPAIPTYVSYDLGANTREYWFEGVDAENNTVLYVYNDTTTAYIINFLDYTGVLDTLPYIEAMVNVEGTSVVIERRKVDVQGSVSMSLVNGRKYNIYVADGTTYSYGDLLMTATTGVQLVLKAADFPKETLLTQKYIHAYAVRNFTAATITFNYEDENNATTIVDVDIFFSNGTQANTPYNSTSQTFVYTYSANNYTAYYLVATITHSEYGTLMYRSTFPQQGSSETPFSLAFLGSLGFNTAYILPAILILFVAGCFSALNAEVGAILMVIMAIVLSWMGWIPIPAGALVASMFFAVLMALMYNKRRVVVY